MTEFLLLLSLWPFHHKPANIRGDGQIDQSIGGTIGRCGATLEDCISPDLCEKSGKLYFYAGDDKLIGISGASCEGAKDNWRKLHIDPVRMSRS